MVATGFSSEDNIDLQSIERTVVVVAAKTISLRSKYSNTTVLVYQRYMEQQVYDDKCWTIYNIMSRGLDTTGVPCTNSHSTGALER